MERIIQMAQILKIQFFHFFEALSRFSLYLFLLKESKKRMPLQSGLGSCLFIKFSFLK
jgi:hypothetical protein